MPRAVSSREVAPVRAAPPRAVRTAVRSATSRHGASKLLFLSSLGTLVPPVIFPRENNQKCVPYPERRSFSQPGLPVVCVSLFYVIDTGV